ncbi:GIY-YIG nuclease family protein [Patescibacteria group bacterium]|nr:MAG: GIY-YIG nuclease family protein [Patescibacteria group bacterium]
MFYTHVLQSRKDSKLYIGCTENLKVRFEKHNAGYSTATSKRGPFTLLYYEACRDKKDVLRREGYLKTTYGGRYLKGRFKSCFRG